VTSATATRLMMSLLLADHFIRVCREWQGCRGISFILKRRKFALHLPSSITAGEAIVHNKTGERLEGLDLGQV